MLRAGVVVATVAGAFLTLPTPAQAASPTVNITASPAGSLRGGETTTLKFKVENGTVLPPQDESIDVSVTTSPGGVLTCSGDCNPPTLRLGSNAESNELTVTLRAGNLGAGESRDITVTINADVQGSSQDGSASRRITVRGPDAPQGVREVTGQVADRASGAAVPGATVAMQDSAGGQFTANADSAGRFRFTSTAAKPIAPGTLMFTAAKEGYETGQPIEKEGRAGQALTGVRIALAAVATTPSAGPPTQEPSVPPTVEATNQATGGAVVPSSDSGGSGLTSWVLIGMGGLLVALGIGAIVLLLLRRRDDGGEDDEDAVPTQPGPRGAAGARPAGAGGYRSGPDPTMVTRAAAVGDRTMITRPALADAPTAMHRPAVDDYPPYAGGGGYGGPPTGDQAYPDRSGYGGAQPGYGSAGAGYGAPAAPGAADSYGRYGDSYGETTQSSRYDDGYGQQGSGYGSGYGSSGGAQGYGPSGSGPGQGSPGGYESGYDSGGGYRDGRYEQGGYGNGYEQPGESAAGYGSGSGYGSPSGYESGGYDSGRYEQGGYDRGGDSYAPRREEGYDPRGGYQPDQRDGGADDGYGNGYYDDRSRRSGGGQHQQPPSRAERRSLDWLDD